MKRVLLASAALLLAACGQPRDSATANEALAEGAGDISRPPETQGGLPLPPAATDAIDPPARGPVPGNDADEEPTGEADEARSEGPAAAAVIPAQYRGRWGMVPADCEPGRSDAKGLIAIGDRTIRFYESTATLREQRPAIATSFSGLFSFTGEGQEWEKVMTFTREGDRLVRAEEEGRYSYTRCAS